MICSVDSLIIWVFFKPSARQLLLVLKAIGIFEIPVFGVLTTANYLTRLFGAMPLALSLAVVRIELLLTSPAGSLTASFDHHYHPL